MKLTQAQIEDIRKRAEAATPGPWGTGIEYEQSSRGNYVYSEKNLMIVCAEQDNTDCQLETEDATFIANARQDIPVLLDYIAQLQSAAFELLEKYKKAEEAVIAEYSHDQERSFSELKEELWQYRKQIVGGKMYCVYIEEDNFPVLEEYGHTYFANKDSANAYRDELSIECDEYEKVLIKEVDVIEE